MVIERRVPGHLRSRERGDQTLDDGHAAPVRASASDSRLRVAIVSDYGHVNGGASKVAIASARALAERGYWISFICGVDPIDPALVHPNIRVRHLDLRDVWTDPNPLRAAAHGIWSRTAAARLATVLAALDERATIVHFHQWTKALSPSAIGAVAGSGLPHVYTMHDYFAFCPNGTYFDHSSNRPCHRRPLSAGCIVAGCDTRSRAHKAVRVVRQAVSDAALRRAAQPLNLIHVSAFARAVASPFFSADTRHFVVPNPVALAQGPPAPVRANRAFVYLGRFTPEKGPCVFAAAARAAGVRAIFRGAGPELERIRRANPEAQLLPWAADDAVQELLQAARALVFPSLWYETSGLVVLEALAMGLPVICSRITAAADWIEDGVNGFLVDAGDVPALKGCLERLCDDEVAERMGREAYERYWRDPPTTAAHAERLIACYRTILKEASAAGSVARP